MTKWEFIQSLSKKTGIKQADVESIVNCFASTIVEECRDNGNDVNVPGLGIFKQKINAARTGHNPSNGQPLAIPESHTVALRVSSSVKKIIEVKKGKKK